MTEDDKLNRNGPPPDRRDWSSVGLSRFPVVVLLAFALIVAACSSSSDEETGNERDGQDEPTSSTDLAPDDSDGADDVDDGAPPTTAQSEDDEGEPATADGGGEDSASSTTVADGREIAGADLTSLPDGVELVAGQPVDAEVLERLSMYVERHTGRSFGVDQQVDVVEADGFRSGIPEGLFVPPEVWDLLLALGLVSPDDDRLDADAVRRESVRGFCCPLSLASGGGPLFNEVVIVHELTHGLDLERSPGGDFGSREPISPLQGLIEGNAHRIAFNYAAQLNALGADLPGPPSIFAPEGDPRLPNAVQQILEFAYDEGHRFAVELAGTGGEAAITEAFGNPPTTSEQILDVSAYLAGEEAAAVEVPDVPSGASALDSGTLGAFLIMLLVEPALGAEGANELATAWGGDSYVLYGQDDEICINSVIEFDDATSADIATEAATDGGLEAEATETQVLISNCTSR